MLSLVELEIDFFFTLKFAVLFSGCVPEDFSKNPGELEKCS